MKPHFLVTRAVTATCLALALLIPAARLFAADPDVYMSSQGAYQRDHDPSPAGWQDGGSQGEHVCATADADVYLKADPPVAPGADSGANDDSQGSAIADMARWLLIMTAAWSH